MLREVIYDDKGDFEIGNFVDGYFSCKGKCDSILKEFYMKKGSYSDGWQDISKFKSPISYIKNLIDLINYMSRDGKMALEKDCLKKFKELIIHTFPYVARESTMEEQKEIEELIELGFGDFI